MNIKPYDPSYNYNLDYSEKPKDNSPPLINFNQLQPTLLTDGKNLQKKTILQISTSKNQSQDNSLTENSEIADEFTEVTVKLEPDLEPLPQKRKNRISLKELNQKLPLINPHFDVKNEIGVENCLPCVISLHNWFNSGEENPKEVDRYAKPKEDHMEPINATTSLLQDPHLEELNNPKIVQKENEEGRLESYTCLRLKLPLTFRPVSLRGLLKEVKKSTIPWKQYEKSGETFKSGMLFLPYKEDEGAAHFLYFYYFQTKSKNKTEDHLYFIDAQPRPPKVFTFKTFLKQYGDSYVDTIKMWCGQNNINYDCNKTVKEMFIDLKKEEGLQQKDPNLSHSIDSIPKDSFVEITTKRKRHLEHPVDEISKKSKSSKPDLENIPNTPEPTKENPWARIAKLALSTPLITTEEDENPFIMDEEVAKLPSRMPSFFNPLSFAANNEEEILGMEAFENHSEKPFSSEKKIDTNTNNKVHMFPNETLSVNQYPSSHHEKLAAIQKEHWTGGFLPESKETFLNGDIYKGGFVDGKPHGKVTCWYKNGGIYTGDFFKGMRHGRGIVSSPDGDFIACFDNDILISSYHGESSNGLPHGKGTWAYTNGTNCAGIFNHGELLGKGIWTFKNGNIYEGDIVNGIPHGKGKMTFPNGDTYQGDFIIDIPHGRGIWTFQDGRVASGNFENAKQTGMGTLTWPNGDVYEGNFLGGLPHIQGKFCWHNGINYVGNIYFGQATGKGIMTFPNQDSYTGDFVNARLHGKGTITWSNGYPWLNGSTFKGKFINNQPQGTGILTKPNGNVYLTFDLLSFWNNPTII